MRIASILLIAAFLLAGSALIAQTGNLVVNGSFESATTPVIRGWPKENPPGSEVVTGWMTPTRATPDYYNSDASVCDGFAIALARTGQGRCAIICGMNPQLPGVKNYKEYLGGKLAEPLKAGTRYNVKFYVALDCASWITSTGIGAYFSKEPVLRENKEKLDVQPQVISYHHLTYADGWTEISGTFTAEGGERYLTIGSFSDTSYILLSSLGQRPMTFFASPHTRQNVYVYVDDVCVSAADDETDACGCKKKEAAKESSHYFLFVLDVSNSMNESGKLKQLKKQVRRFADSLGPGSRVGILTFSDHTTMVLPFSSPADKDAISGAIGKIEAGGSTNGELAIRRVTRLLDSMQVPGRCHVIMATDGIFQLNRFTKTLADSSFARNHASFCVLQFGESKNADLEELSRTIPESSYHSVSRKNLSDVLEEQLPEEEAPEPPKSVQTVYYTAYKYLAGLEFLRLFIAQNPQDRFTEIPRK